MAVNAYTANRLTDATDVRTAVVELGQATMAERILRFDEWIPDPSNTTKAYRTVVKLERKYQLLTGQVVEILPGPEPSGSGALGEFFPESGRTVLYEAGKHQFSLGAEAEELLHYFNYRARGLLGLTAQEIGNETIKAMEVLVERSLQKCGFVRFRSS